ncbi:hypothetical protein DFA_10250 [Cavenderia fasciculata]|uniref:Uncharacterized protein n=1 Tax=Cavenderia fasciculata TaxID=261658 RepID=F4Q9P6_CACFS|nr:uncharacterized protein DFA_10250 [Cavenderia fasciculata]EGG15415.1 hypothetical protein DFA_10250 [Cavenderia fasciculata]|eukprot:XP_004354157.1 hypothetical protein DFA_10250 [Cavenderia fasciculata]
MTTGYISIITSLFMNIKRRCDLSNVVFFKGTGISYHTFFKSINRSVELNSSSRPTTISPPPRHHHHNHQQHTSQCHHTSSSSSRRKVVQGKSTKKHLHHMHDANYEYVPVVKQQPHQSVPLLSNYLQSMIITKFQYELVIDGGWHYDRRQAIDLAFVLCVGEFAMFGDTGMMNDEPNNLSQLVNQMKHLSHVTVTGTLKQLITHQPLIISLFNNNNQNNNNSNNHNQNNNIKLDCNIKRYHFIHNPLWISSSQDGVNDQPSLLEEIENANQLAIKVNTIFIKDARDMELEKKILEMYRPRKVVISFSREGHFSYASILGLDFIENLFIVDDYVELKDMNVALGQSQSTTTSMLKKLNVKLPTHFYSFEISKTRRDKMRDNPCSYKFPIPRYTPDYDPQATMELFVNLLTNNTTITDLTINNICTKDHSQAPFFRHCKALVDCLAMLLVRNHTLKHLELRGIDCLDTRFFESIATCTLHSLSFYSPIANQHCIDRLCHSINTNRSLCRFDINFSAFQGDNEESLAKIINQLQTTIPTKTMVINIYNGKEYIRF